MHMPSLQFKDQSAIESYGSRTLIVFIIYITVTVIVIIISSSSKNAICPFLLSRCLRCYC